MKHLKSICLFTLALVLCCAVGLLLAHTHPAKAATIVKSGYCGGEGDGTNLTWTLDDERLLTISGTGAMKNYDLYLSGECPWMTAPKTVIIESGVTSIGDWAFNFAYNLTSVTIPDSVTSIGYGAFRDCTSLTSITIPGSVTSIGTSAFEGCTSLTSVTIPDSVTSIGGSAFWGCISLPSITIPDSVTSIGYGAFWRCTSLTSIELPYSVESVGSNAFEKCSALESIYFYNRNCSISSGKIPKNVTIYGYAESTAERYANNNVLIFREITNHTHTPKLSGAYAPTCGEPGFTRSTICSMCGEVLTPGQEIPATGDHTFGDWTVTKAPTCVDKGTETRTCAVCKKTETREVDATGNHAFGAWTETTAATVDAEGEETRTCSVCGKTETRAIPKVEKPAVTADNIGDVDHDGKITASDARLALRAAVGLESFDEETADVADADRDGKITASDARLILRAAVGLEDRKNWLAA